MEADIIERFDQMENKLGRKLDGINDALVKIAVQKTRLDGVSIRVDGLWKKLDDTILPALQDCPREQVKYLWWVVVPMALVQLGMGLTLIKLALS